MALMALTLQFKHFILGASCRIASPLSHMLCRWAHITKFNLPSQLNGNINAEPCSLVSLFLELHQQISLNF